LSSQIIIKNNNNDINTTNNRKKNLLNNENSDSSSSPYIFGALKFESDFECSRFFDFYRNLFVNSQNDDLFNPHFKQSKSSSSTTTTTTSSLMRFLCKKINKNCISSPCAFQHINSLSMVNEEVSPIIQQQQHQQQQSTPPMLIHPDYETTSYLGLSTTSDTITTPSSDTQSMKSELTATSHQ
jgi:hypothetical protein